MKEKLPTGVVVAIIVVVVVLIGIVGMKMLGVSREPASSAQDMQQRIKAHGGGYGTGSGSTGSPSSGGMGTGIPGSGGRSSAHGPTSGGR